ncbi:hypothetical protein EMPG_10267 [Blastomyces silverae]|uniref:Uncharacterized protein n=1 Tax=Blastomyces silverae TaxID=2060906 RepID=A0A0H1B4P3_9EURO|nr:hypothetical protein EMPG_10267 [Blastomyces silverae]
MTLMFTFMTGTQVTDLHEFFDKFCDVMMKLKSLKISMTDIHIKIKLKQTSKLMSVILKVHSLMKEICVWLNSLKNAKKPVQSVNTMINAAQSDAVAAGFNNNN